jgi:hypothetical protein
MTRFGAAVLRKTTRVELTYHQFQVGPVRVM